MNKTDLVKDVVNRVSNLELNKVDVKKVVDETVNSIAETISSGESVTLLDFGVFSLRTRLAHKGRNPKTGEVLDIPEKRVVRFRPSLRLRKAVSSV